MIMRTDKIAFLHFRVLDEKNQIKPKGGLTVAYRLYETEGYDKVTIEYYSSFCSYKDHYNRKIGGQVSSGKLAKYGGRLFVLDRNTWFNNFEYYLLSSLDNYLPFINTSRAKVKIG